MKEIDLTQWYTKKGVDRGDEREKFDTWIYVMKIVDMKDEREGQPNNL